MLDRLKERFAVVHDTAAISTFEAFQTARMSRGETVAEIGGRVMELAQKSKAVGYDYCGDKNLQAILIKGLSERFASVKELHGNGALKFTTADKLLDHVVAKEQRMAMGEGESGVAERAQAAVHYPSWPPEGATAPAAGPAAGKKKKKGKGLCYKCREPGHFKQRVSARCCGACPARARRAARARARFAARSTARKAAASGAGGRCRLCACCRRRAPRPSRSWRRATALLLTRAARCTCATRSSSSASGASWSGRRPCSLAWASRSR